MAMVEQELHEVIIGIANYRERKLIQAGGTSAAGESALRRLRTHYRVLSFALFLAVMGAFLGPLAAASPSSPVTFPPLAVIACVIPPLSIQMMRQGVSQLIARLETLLKVLPNRCDPLNHCRV